MMSSTLGAPFGGTTRGGHHGFDSVAFSLITPPNFGSGGGSCLPSDGGGRAGRAQLAGDLLRLNGASCCNKRATVEATDKNTYERFHCAISGLLLPIYLQWSKRDTTVHRSGEIFLRFATIANCRAFLAGGSLLRFGRRFQKLRNCDELETPALKIRNNGR